MWRISKGAGASFWIKENQEFIDSPKWMITISLGGAIFLIAPLFAWTCTPALHRLARPAPGASAYGMIHPHQCILALPRHVYPFCPTRLGFSLPPPRIISLYKIIFLATAPWRPFIAHQAYQPSYCHQRCSSLPSLHSPSSHAGCVQWLPRSSGMKSFLYI